MTAAHQSIAFDHSAAPLLRVRYPSAVTTETIDEYLRQLQAVYAGPPWAALIDLRACKPNSLNPFLVRLSQATDALGAAHPNKLLGEAVVIASDLQQGTYTAYRWIKTARSYPWKAFTDVDEAEAWLRQVLAEVNGP